MNIAVVVGHDKKSPGAYSPFVNASEYVFNSEVATYLKGCDVYKRSGIGSYKQQMQALADVVNPKGYDLVIELHFNAFNKKAQGVETVGWKGNKTSEDYGKKYCTVISEYYDITNRGIKFVENNGRGYWFNYYINANSLILEPFFGDEQKAKRFEDPKELACVMMEWFKIL